MSEDYKSKYDDLMKRCAEFMKDFAPLSPYELGFKAGWEAAKQEFHKDNTYVPDTTKPAKTLDIQWPPTMPVVYQACGVCGIGGGINKAMGYVCNNPQCPLQG